MSGRRRVFLHVGLPKTGTTYLQDLMRTHRQELRAAGVSYPDDGHRDHFFAALDARGDHVFAGAVRPAAQDAWPRLVELARSDEDTVVLGHEVMATAPPEQAQAALSLLDDREVHVVVTARDPGRQVVADWQESVKHGRRHTFDQYLERAGLRSAEDATVDGPVPFRAQRLTTVLDAWGRGLPPDQVHVITVPRPGADPGLLWRRFAGVVGVSDPDRFAPGADVRLNPSLGVADVEVMRRVSGFVDRRLVAGEFGAVAKNLYAQDVLPRVSRTPPPVPPKDLLPTLQAMATSWVDTITARGYDVRGDLSELHPAADAEGRTPDDWDPEEVIDTATAATAELLVEVARLRRELASGPSPRTRASRWLGVPRRAARRLARR